MSVLKYQFGGYLFFSTTETISEFDWFCQLLALKECSLAQIFSGPVSILEYCHIKIAYL